MKIDRIEIVNYKAFIGTHEILVKGKNLFIYGENGSGKSSLNLTKHRQYCSWQAIFLRERSQHGII
jgi:predicted ATP-binding protein involved in virulence